MIVSKLLCRSYCGKKMSEINFKFSNNEIVAY
jgi:hypothetical protein